MQKYFARTLQNMDSERIGNEKLYSYSYTHSTVILIIKYFNIIDYIINVFSFMSVKYHLIRNSNTVLQ